MPLRVAFFGALFTYFVITLWLSRVPELFRGGFEIGEVMKALSMSFITGFCFYFVTVQLKANADRKNIGPFVARRIEKIIDATGFLLSELQQVGYPLSLPPAQSEIEALFGHLSVNSNIRPHIVSHTSKAPYTWFELFVVQKSKTEREIDYILELSSHVDAELINILGQLIDSEFWFWVDECKKLGPQFNQLSMLVGPFTGFIQIHVRLFKYAQKHRLLKRTAEELEVLRRIADGEVLSPEQIATLAKKPSPGA
jgi:hypothetical protein